MLLTSMRHLARRCITVDMSKLLQYTKRSSRYSHFPVTWGETIACFGMSLSPIWGEQTTPNYCTCDGRGLQPPCGPWPSHVFHPGWAGGQRKFSSHEAWSQVFGILHMSMSQESPNVQDSQCRTLRRTKRKFSRHECKEVLKISSKEKPCFTTRDILQTRRRRSPHSFRREAAISERDCLVLS